MGHTGYTSGADIPWLYDLGNGQLTFDRDRCISSYCARYNARLASLPVWWIKLECPYRRWLLFGSVTDGISKTKLLSDGGGKPLSE